MKYAIAILLLTASIAPAQFFPSFGPGRRNGSGGGGGGSSATFKSAATISNAASGTTLTTSGSLNVASGDLIVALVAGNSNPSRTVTCGADTLTAISGASWYDGSYTVTAYMKENATANAAATCSVTFGFAVTFRSITAANWGGVLTSSSLLNASCVSSPCSTLAAASTSRTALNVTTSTANALLVGLGVDWDGISTHAAANGYTVRVDGDTPFLADKSVNATGTYPSGAFTTGASEQYISFFLAFGLQ